MNLRPLVALAVAAALVPLASCKLLKKDSPDAAAASASAADTSAPADSSSADTTPSATASAGPLVFTTACVDPTTDAKKVFSGDLDPRDVDLDGDGQKDKIIHIIAGGMNDPYVVYIMRGKCGHRVFDTMASGGIDTTKLRNHGLVSLDETVKNCGPGGDCSCYDTVDHLAFNGTKYVSLKQTKVYPFGPCDAGAPSAAPTASAPAASAYKVGDKVTVEWQGKDYPAAIIAVPGPNQYKVHYDNYAAKWDEVVGPSRIRGKR